MNQIAEASKRISALLAGAKQYSQMDRARVSERRRPRAAAQHAHDVRRQGIGQGQAGQAGQGPDKSLPELLCYPGDLNQVWTNIIDNAIQAMDGHGTLTIRTVARERADDPRRDLR